MDEISDERLDKLEALLKKGTPGYGAELWEIEFMRAFYMAAPALLVAARRERKLRAWVTLLAAWERENGTIAAIMPAEYEDLMEKIRTLAINVAEFSVRPDVHALVARRAEQAEAEAARLRAALEAIKNAPGGGPGKRIATLALED